MILLFTVGAILAPPFSGLDTLPALGVVLIGLRSSSATSRSLSSRGDRNRGIALIVTLGRAAAHLIQSWF